MELFIEIYIYYLLDNLSYNLNYKLCLNIKLSLNTIYMNIF